MHITSQLFIRQWCSVNIDMSICPKEQKEPSKTYIAHVQRGYKPHGNHLILTSKSGRKLIILMAHRNLI